MATTDVHLDLLDRIRIASPCPMRWDDLEGDGPVRHCRQCDLDVHNLSEMTRAEVEELFANRTGRLCGALFRRADGSILTKDCPIGLRAARIRTAKMLGRVAAAIGVLIAGSAVTGRSRPYYIEQGLRGVQPFAALSRWMGEGARPVPYTPPFPLLEREMLGAMEEVEPRGTRVDAVENAS